MTVATNHQQHRTAQCRGGQGPVAATRTAHSPAALNKHQDRSASVSPGRAGCLLPVGQLGRAFGLGSLSRRADRCRPQFTPVSVDPDEIHELRICELTGRQAVLSRALLSTSGNGPATNTTERTDHDRA